MARIPLIEPESRADLAALVGKIGGARRGKISILYRTLLHCPPIASVWCDFVSVLRDDTQIDEQTKELATMRVAILNKSDYILRIHRESYAIEAGLTAGQLDDLADWKNSSLFNDRESALLSYVDAMTLSEVTDRVFSTLKMHFNERQVIEITVLIGLYNMHSRVLQALQAYPEPSR